MQLTYQDDMIVLNRDASAFELIFDKVNDIVENEKKVFSHLLIDNVAVYENHEQYINVHRQDIHQITIIARTVTEMIDEIMVSIYQYLERAIPAMKQLVSQSENGLTEETWTGIQQLTEGMQWMLQFVETIRASAEKPKNWTAIDESFHDCEAQFTELLEAIEAKDPTFIVDLLAYGILPAYEDFQDNIADALGDRLESNDIQE